MKLKKVCAWCDKVVAEGDGTQVDVSHVICYDCQEKFEQEDSEVELILETKQLPDMFYQAGR